MHFGTEQELEQGITTGDIAAGDLPPSVPALILPTPDGPALSDPTPDGPALSDPTPDGSPPSPAQLQCDVYPVSALVHYCSTSSPVPSLSPAPTLDATAFPAP